MTGLPVLRCQDECQLCTCAHVFPVQLSALLGVFARRFHRRYLGVSPGTLGPSVVRKLMKRQSKRESNSRQLFHFCSDFQRSPVFAAGG